MQLDDVRPVQSARPDTSTRAERKQNDSRLIVSEHAKTRRMETINDKNNLLALLVYSLDYQSLRIVVNKEDKIFGCYFLFIFFISFSFVFFFFSEKNESFVGNELAEYVIF